MRNTLLGDTSFVVALDSFSFGRFRFVLLPFTHTVSVFFLFTLSSTFFINLPDLLCQIPSFRPDPFCFDLIFNLDAFLGTKS